LGRPEIDSLGWERPKLAVMPPEAVFPSPLLGEDDANDPRPFHELEHVCFVLGRFLELATSWPAVVIPYGDGGSQPGHILRHGNW